jgi:hypothetical protein
MTEFKLIRGARIIQQMQMLLDEATYNELERRTMTFTPITTKRQWAVDPIQITNMELVVAQESQHLQINATAQSNGKIYQPQILFEDVIYEDSDQNDNISFVSATGDTHHIMPIELQRNAVKVRCTCLDFYWRFASQDKTNRALLGKSPPLYQKRTDRPPSNPTNAPGVCKHLMKTVVALKDAGLVK